MSKDLLYFEDLEPGSLTKSSRRTVTEADIVLFAGLSGDFNPLHVDEEFAKTSIFGKRVAHGLLGLSIASGLQVPIPPTAVMAFMGIEWKFVKPIFAGDTVHYVNTIRSRRELKDKEGGIVIMGRELINQHGDAVQKGTFTLLVRYRPAP